MTWNLDDAEWTPARINVPLLRKTLEYVEDHPKEWNQSWYRFEHPDCGSQFCFAGTAVQLEASSRWISDGFGWYWLEAIEEDGEASTVVGGTNLVSASSRAARLLGLNGRTAAELFYSGNSLADLRNIVHRLIAEAESAQAAG